MIPDVDALQPEFRLEDLILGRGRQVLPGSHRDCLGQCTGNTRQQDLLDGQAAAVYGWRGRGAAAAPGRPRSPSAVTWLLLAAAPVKSGIGVPSTRRDMTDGPFVCGDSTLRRPFLRAV